MKRVFRITDQRKVKDVGHRGLVEHPEVERVDTTVALLQALIPLGLQAVGEALEAEVVRLAGPRHSRTGRRPGHVRWGAQPGSVYLLDQKLPLPVPRVRDLARQRFTGRRPGWSTVPPNTMREVASQFQLRLGLTRALGVFGYLGHLAYSVFKDSRMFPFVLSVLGIVIIYLGIKYQRHRDVIDRSILGLLPEQLRHLLPRERVGG